MSLNPDARAALDEVLARQDPAILGIVLSGSAARGIATEHSDVDVLVVLTDDAAEGRETSRSAAIDEIPHTRADLEDVPPWGHDEYGCRWLRECLAWDQRHGGHDLYQLIEDWGAEPALLRGT